MELSFPAPSLSSRRPARRIQPGHHPRARNPGAQVERLGVEVPVAPQRHLVVLGGDNFETGRSRLVDVGPAALDPGWASRSPQPFTQHRLLSPHGPWNRHLPEQGQVLRGSNVASGNRAAFGVEILKHFVVWLSALLPVVLTLEPCGGARPAPPAAGRPLGPSDAQGMFVEKRKSRPHIRRPGRKGLKNKLY